MFRNRALWNTTLLWSLCLESFLIGQMTVISGHDSTFFHFFAPELASFPGHNASCCDFKQLFPRIAGVALHVRTREDDGQTVGPIDRIVCRTSLRKTYGWHYLQLVILPKFVQVPRFPSLSLQVVMPPPRSVIVPRFPSLSRHVFIPPPMSVIVP